MNAAIHSILSGSRSRFLLLDSNLLILWITAKYDLRLLSTFKRVNLFTQSDAVLLGWIIDEFRSVITTSHVVTEASNLGNSLSAQTRAGWFAVLADFASATPEETDSLKVLVNYQEFLRFGLTDTALHKLADKYQVLTVDRRLSNYASQVGVRMLNFHDLQQMV